VTGWFADLVTYGAVPVLVALGIVAAGLCMLRGQVRAGLGLGLDLWLAAGLLTLAVTTSWSTIATVAIIVVIRHLATRSIDRAVATRRAGA
jgi:Protein of unknown function (DUF1622)